MNLQRMTGVARPNTAVAVLVVVLVAVNAVILLWLLAVYPAGVDLEIPLRAATRWLSGGDPYPPGAFNAPDGPDLPFLYPPFVLPLIAPLTVLPRAIPLIGWWMVLVASGYLACRRLGFGPVVAAVTLLWPPFFEGILGGNVQILLFAAFAILMYREGRQLDPRDHERPAWVEGVLGAFVGALKVSQVHTWVYLLRRRKRAAIIGLSLFATIAIASLPFVGLDSWVHWAFQAGRAGDPAWRSIGGPLSIFVGQPIALGASVMSLLAIPLVPPRQAGAWVGILTVIGAPSLHSYGLLFLLPAMRLVRREVGLVAAVLIATYQWPLVWIAILGIAWTLLASARWPLLRATEAQSG